MAKDEITGPDDRDGSTIRFKLPAEDWNEGFPLGNGRLGAMLLSSPVGEIIELNEETLWSGIPRPDEGPASRSALADARQRIKEGRYREAQDLLEAGMGGRTPEAFQPLGTLSVLRTGAGGRDAEAGISFSRALDLRSGIARVSIAGKESRETREAFVSAVDGVLAFRWSVDRGMLHDMDIAFSSPHPSARIESSERGLVITERMPAHLPGDPAGNGSEPPVYEDGRGVLCRAGFRVVVEGGSARAEARRGISLRVSGARRVALFLAAETDFSSWNEAPGGGEEALARACEERLDAAERSGWGALRARHEEDHARIFDRMSLELCSAPERDDAGGTGERIAAYRKGGTDAGLEALVFAYARYLLMASSRPGGQPANLQGIWNPLRRPPWYCDYTLNVNAGMNYWPAEPCALGDCHEPLLRMTAELAVAGERTASLRYGCRGWAAHHNSDLWRMTGAAAGDASWAFWPMGGALLCRHLWDRWLYGRDRAYLETLAWPVLRGNARFIIDWLVEGEDGRLGTLPSSSPENKFLDREGRPCALASSSAMDLALARDSLRIALEAGELVGDSGIREEAASALARLAHTATDAEGRPLEWSLPFPEAEPGHRHFSPLYGLYPADSLAAEGVSAAAMERFLDERIAAGSGSTGWSASWAACLYARLGRGEKAHAMLARAIRDFTLPNLLGNHPPFQIDANFGMAAAMVEMLARDADGEVRLLPALPSAWADGAVRGLRLKGNHGLDMEWRAGKLVRARLRSEGGGNLRLSCGDAAVSLELGPGGSAEFGPGLERPR